MTAILMILLKISVVATIVSVGAGTTPGDLTYLWRRPWLLFRSLVAMYVLVPLVAFVLVLIVPMERGAKAAILVLAVSSGAPLLPKKLKKLRSSQYIFSLLATSSLVAIVAVPLWVAMLGAYFDVTIDLPVGTVSWAIVKAIVLPIAIGMLLRALFPKWSERLSDPIIAIAGVVLVASGIALLAIHWQLILAQGWLGVLGLTALMIFALTIGHFLGGPNRDDRTALAIACATRHVGIALVVAAEFVGRRTAVLIVGYVLTVVIVSSIYLTRRR
jgi:bile acid:Na+ symporter, BASS family